uniref:Calcium-binding atopy-related autoantigen 1 n=1 Tax=Aegilops tauschii TaxID=37682 RepID=R7WAV8_AEGTA
MPPALADSGELARAAAPGQIAAAGQISAAAGAVEERHEKKTRFLLADSYRRRVFFNYEKRIRLRSPPEKIFEYFASVRKPDGEMFMLPADLMRAVVPVFPPSESNVVREGRLRGEPSPGELHCAPSKFFVLFDTNTDGLISFAEYIFFVTLLSIPESSFSAAFKMFDVDLSGCQSCGNVTSGYAEAGGSASATPPGALARSRTASASEAPADVGGTLQGKGWRGLALGLVAAGAGEEAHLAVVVVTRLISLVVQKKRPALYEHVQSSGLEIDKEEFKKVMALMRSYNRQGAAHRHGLRTGFKVGQSVENGGVVEYFFGNDGNEPLHFDKFTSFLKELHEEIIRLEFSHYDVKSTNTIPAKDFALSMVASADMNHISKLLDRADTLENDPYLKHLRITFEMYFLGLQEFKAFADLRRRLESLTMAIFAYGQVNGLLTKQDLKRAAQHVCGVELTDRVVDIIFHVFDMNNDGHLSSEEFLRALQRREADIHQPAARGGPMGWLNPKNRSSLLQMLR